MRHWEVHALRYARHEGRRAADNFLLPTDLHDADTPLDYYIWVLQSGERTIVVDTGFGAEQAARRGRTLLTPVDELLRRLGVAAATVDEVVITHLHYDHAGNLGLFPKARFHLQEREMSFATGRHMCQACQNHPFHVEDVVAMVRAVYANRVSFHAGDAEVAEGVSLHHVGGHTDGLQMVRVETARGPVVLMSDASHLYANRGAANPFPIIFEREAMEAGWQRALELAGSSDRLVPGHDPRVREWYPPHALGGGEIVALHVPPRTA